MRISIYVCGRNSERVEESCVIKNLRICKLQETLLRSKTKEHEKGGKYERQRKS
jgi:hypothetical protein